MIQFICIAGQTYYPNVVGKTAQIPSSVEYLTNTKGGHLFLFGSRQLKINAQRVNNGQVTLDLSDGGSASYNDVLYSEIVNYIK